MGTLCISDIRNSNREFYPSPFPRFIIPSIPSVPPDPVQASGKKKKVFFNEQRNDYE